MNRFADLLDRLEHEPSGDHGQRLLADYFRRANDPDRGYALAAMTGALPLPRTTTAVARALIAERVDPALFAMSREYVGDLVETVALLWPAPAPLPAGRDAPPAPTLAEVVETLRVAGKAALPAQLAILLDGLDATGRRTLLKLVTGGARIAISARRAKAAVASLAGLDAGAVEEIWRGLEPPYLDLFAWIEGRGPRPGARDPAPFREPTPSRAIDEADFAALDPAAFLAEWKWDGLRVQASGGVDGSGARVRRLYSSSGEDISAAFPDLVEALSAPVFDGAILDGELLIVRDGCAQPLDVWRQRLGRKRVSAKTMAEYPPRLRAFDLLAENGEDLRALPFETRRERLEDLVARRAGAPVDLSPLIPFSTREELSAARADPASAGAGRDAGAVVGVMLKERARARQPEGGKGQWLAWKRDPTRIDAVLMYARRGQAIGSSLHSDFTFGVWRTRDGRDELVPVGAACFDGADAELDAWVRAHTINRFGPVREVVASGGEGLVLEIVFEGADRSTRRKAGLTLRNPRVAGIRRDKPPREADRIETVETFLRG